LRSTGPFVDRTIPDATCDERSGPFDRVELSHQYGPDKVTSFIQYFGGDFFREKTMPSFSRLISAAPDSATICYLQTCSKLKIAY
jgi:hypothetical protein